MASGSVAPATPALTYQVALDMIKESFPEQALVLERVIKGSVVALGEHEAFALRTKDGREIRAFKQNLTLSAKEGTLNKPVSSGPYAISAQGYEKWANTVGAQVIFPRQVLVNGEWKENKHPTYDPKTGQIISYHVHAVAYRYSEKGILIYTDWTIIYDVRAYRMIDLLGKAKDYPQAFRLMPNDLGKPEDRGTWAGYPMDDQTTLWINTSHDEALTWYAQIKHREKKSLDTAQSFARRNASKHLSGLQKAPGDTWTFPVICWRPVSGDMVKWDETVFVQAQDATLKLTGGPAETRPIMISGGTMHVEATDEMVIDSEDTDEGEDGGITDEQRENAIDLPAEAQPAPDSSKNEPATAPEAPPQNAPLSEEDQRVLANLASTKKFMAEEYDQACAALGLKVPADPSNLESATAKKLMAEINRIVDSGAPR